MNLHPELKMTTSAQLKTIVDEYVNSLEFSSMKPANLYGPMAYILSMKGKRIRPILTMLAYQAVSGQDPKNALKLGTSVELFHNFTLMHDDIMDRAPFRRGMPSVHIKWNEDVAILSGDALFAFSMGMVIEEFPEKAAALAREFSQVSMAVCEGQMEDMDLAKEDEVEIPIYVEMIRKKTAALLGGCLALGAIAAGADEELVEKFRAYGESLGIAFQLQDDLMDAFPPEGFGKQVGGDIIENKKTYLLLKARELASAGQQSELNQWFSTQECNSDEKVAAVLNIFNATDVKGHTQALIQDYFEKAISLGEELAEETHFEMLKDYLQVISKRKL
ncbi:MAG: polyprenyl synthetase family protein [Bacteroidia bacterium]|nr:polyprenyl synthetase family protein [Bacteroidia bacterium]